MEGISLFEHALKIAPESRDLGNLACPSRRAFDDQVNVLFHAQLPCLENASLQIEHALLLRPNRCGRIYAGVECLSHMTPLIDWYLRIVDMSDAVYVFGLRDWQPPRHPNLRYIALLPEFNLAHERFLIVDCPNQYAALVAREMKQPAGESSESRRFDAFNSSEPATVSLLALALEKVIDQSGAVKD
ncbi:MAG TPA: hypothetical protein VGN86_05700 [Pyrinomonadaceae bacterium]|nr:hypothetical protein [Pyrinomonadaceae bacterium]